MPSNSMHSGFALIRWIAALVGLTAAMATLGCAARRPALLAPCFVTAATAESRLEILSRPFEGEYPAGSLFDHDLPVLFDDGNDYLLNMCGQRTKGTRGHNGYDWNMPVGTPLLAVADGRIVRAEREPVTCGGRPGPGARVVVIEIRPNATDVIHAMYGHLERIDVKTGDTVQVGDIIGTSGNTGCSTRPHLHLNVARVFDGREVLVDPYGWHSQLTDLWAVDARGAKSVWLWKPSAAPRLFR
jgi:murein DD-endopeptidase MepM/ murein hydrolase activator NlpD